MIMFNPDALRNSLLAGPCVLLPQRIYVYAQLGQCSLLHGPGQDGLTRQHAIYIAICQARTLACLEARDIAVGHDESRVGALHIALVLLARIRIVVAERGVIERSVVRPDPQGLQAGEAPAGAAG